MYSLRVNLEFTEEVLGSCNSNPEIHKEFIASKAPDAKKLKDEVEALGVEEVEKKEMTIFPKLDDGTPFLWDYQMKGMFKNAAKAMFKIGGDYKLKAYKTSIDNLIFIQERKIPYQLPEGGKIGNCQRPLRASTPQGERVALANSETIPAGTHVEFTIDILDESLLSHVIRWLDYGKRNGLGQWHNSGKGRFTWTEVSREKLKL